VTFHTFDPVSSRLSSTLLLLLVGVLWGLNWPVIKLLMTELPVFTIRAIAFPIAAIILAIIALLKKETLWPSGREFIALMLTGTLLVFGFNMLTSLGQSLTEASKAAIVAYTMPAMTAALSVVFLKESMDRRVVIALFAGMLGIAVLLSENFEKLVDYPAGVITMLCAALCWALGNIALKANTWTLSSTARAAWFFAISTLLCWPVVWLLEDPANLQIPSPSIIGLMVFHIAGPMVLCYQLWALLLTRLPASVAAISVLTAPVVGVLSSVWLVGDELSTYKVVALVLIVASIGITQLRKSD